MLEQDSCEPTAPPTAGPAAGPALDARSAGSPSRHGGRALVVEHDDDYAALISLLLRRDGWAVERVQSARDALERLAGGFAVVLVNVNLVAADDGGVVLQQLRRSASVPVITLSDADTRDEVIEEAVETADYDLVKPFSPRRLRAAVRAVARRGPLNESLATSPAEVRVGDVSMSLGRLEVAIGDRRVELSPREFALLHLLLAHPGMVYTRDELARLAWGWRGNADSRAIDNTIRRLRRKIETDSRHPRLLLTERGAGYRFAVS